MRWGLEEIVRDECSCFTVCMYCKGDGSTQAASRRLENRLIGSTSWTVTALKIIEFHKPDMQLLYIEVQKFL